jgi:hypothetical protein
LLTFVTLPCAFAQDEAGQESEPAPARDLTLPPQIQSAPGDVVLEPPTEDRDGVLEAVVTGGQTDFRLPDLGTSFRDDDEEGREPGQRMTVTFLNLYDPENQDPAEEMFPSLEERLGVGMLRIFRINIGSRDRAD